MGYDVKIVADSIESHGIRITTMEVTYPLIIHAEMLRHRMLSRSVMSNRAVPVAKMIQSILDDPFIPERWPLNKKGMQNELWLTQAQAEVAKQAWLTARDGVVAQARQLADIGVHKQITNRILGPFLWTTEVITATKWANFFYLRCDPAAQPEMQKIAYMMQEAYFTHEPKLLNPGELHLPYITDKDWDEVTGYITMDANITPGFKAREIREYIKFASVGRCASVSYLRQGEDTWDAMTASGKGQTHAMNRHWSVFEHVAECLRSEFPDPMCGNFVQGWRQFRKQFEYENVTRFEPNYKL
jgi:hypothetical protein